MVYLSRYVIGFLEPGLLSFEWGFQDPGSVVVMGFSKVIEASRSTSGRRGKGEKGPRHHLFEQIYQMPTRPDR